MERRAALAFAATLALSVFAVGSAITSNLRIGEAEEASTETPTSPTTLPEPTVVRLTVPAVRAPAAVAAPSAGSAPAFDDHGGDDSDDDDGGSGHGRGRGRGRSGDDDRDDD